LSAPSAVRGKPMFGGNAVYYMLLFIGVLAAY